MTLAIEPMVNAGTYKVEVGNDGWTVRTADGKPSAHFEHTIVVRDGDAEILTRHDLLIGVDGEAGTH
jgi:methionyl aminopeptidase